MNVNPFSYLIEKLKSKVDTAGTGLTKSGTTISTHVPRVNQNANTKPGQHRFNILEYDNASTNLPTNNFYHILTTEGQDTPYAVQLALGMTTEKVFYRICVGDSWWAWKELAFKSDITNVKTEVSVYDNGLFPTSKNVINSYQYCCVARNTGNGALYLLWYDAGSQGFRVGSVISGNSPSNGDSCVVSYPI